jgi:hypothetical protein
MQDSPIHPWEHKPAQALGRLIPSKRTGKQTVNCNQTQIAEGVDDMLNLPQRKEESKGATLSMKL